MQKEVRLGVLYTKRNNASRTKKLLTPVPSKSHTATNMTIRKDNEPLKFGTSNPVVTMNKDPKKEIAEMAVCTVVRV